MMTEIWQRLARVFRAYEWTGPAGKQLDQLVFVTRRSPNWGALAFDYEAGRDIDPKRYVPPEPIPGFPPNVEICIEAWNKTFAVNFFRCRQILRAISNDLISTNESAICIDAAGWETVAQKLFRRRILLFFHDDDDWFSPVTYKLLADLDYNGIHVAVFPLIRFDADTSTFARPGESARVIVGNQQPFFYRYQTNNYAIVGGAIGLESLRGLQDHVRASEYAGQLGLIDCYFDVLIAATNKTPCSAGYLPGLLNDPSAFRAFVASYCEHLQHLPIPPEASWCRPSILQTLDLFRRALASSTA